MTLWCVDATAKGGWDDGFKWGRDAHSIHAFIGWKDRGRQLMLKHGILMTRCAANTRYLCKRHDLLGTAACVALLVQHLEAVLVLTHEGSGDDVTVPGRLHCDIYAASTVCRIFVCVCMCDMAGICVTCVT